MSRPLLESLGEILEGRKGERRKKERERGKEDEREKRGKEKGIWRGKEGKL